MTEPIVSVILPAYNAGEYLIPAVRSVLSDGFDDLELRVYDDGSIDGSVDALLAAVDDPRLVVVRHANRGLAATLNRGFEEARGRYLARMDGDDQVVPGRFGTQAAFLDEHPDVVLVGGQIERLVDGRTESESRFPASHEEIVAGLVAGRHVVTHPSVMIRADAITTVGGYWEHGVSEDWDLFLRLAEHGRLANVDRVVLRYRFHDSGINASSMGKVRRNIRLAVENHRRRVAGEPELTPDAMWRAIGPVGRFGVTMQTRSLTLYRTALQAKASGHRARAALALAGAAVCWPQQALHRLRSH
ncbi:glycosyltransferase family 2 protein [Amnibacterium kyonggiense]|uniref:Glycosyltransferase involved in cell wall biosynthesis n=1 Tax=Amnibacterium kyonggiense TaxID=595671 RepID=A0A4R7FGY8_9MICO|nr:glycosyltransferase family 2 protein [Amnibacterium kyonggiense]TDS74890.1 glycosyltransferase involved in cell wall biosynthesis [Amnibacterium kyonggiense]